MTEKLKQKVIKSSVDFILSKITYYKYKGRKARNDLDRKICNDKFKKKKEIEIKRLYNKWKIAKEY